MAKRRGKQLKGGFVKVVKNKPYFKRYQVKFRRRREGKTDYQARKRLITQDKNKYNSPKYRLIVRFTNRDVVCQIAYAQIKGDVIIASAYSHELPKYGIKVGLTNYAAAYATGLLLGRRVLQKLNLADKYLGKEVTDGEDYLVEEMDDGPKPFYALLDVGLAKTSSGARVFAAMKGACDAGVEVPHSASRFIGYDEEADELNAETFRKHIFGGHVAEYMNILKEENAERYQKQFSNYIENSVSPDSVESMYENAHKAIRKDPTFVPTKKSTTKKSYKTPKLTLEQRKAGVLERIAAHNAQKEN